METIRSRMKKRGITMKMVAVASGTNVSTVSQILNENLNDRVKTAADRLIGVVDQEIVGNLNSEAYLQ
jgi:lambda repressor-like predicted transcriptional regulator